MLIGSGIKQQGGTVLVYRSTELAKGTCGSLYSSCYSIQCCLWACHRDEDHHGDASLLLEHTGICTAVCSVMEPVPWLVHPVVLLQHRWYASILLSVFVRSCAGWRLVGELCSGHADDGMGTGIVWECPVSCLMRLLSPFLSCLR